jgi:S-DNA-T family DNA segregation ATPase FtsK/SpoIIIE
VSLQQLAADIALETFCEAVAEGGDVLAPIGTAFDDLLPAVLSIAAGEHVLVVGPARSGRTTVLETIADRWATAREGGWVGSIAPRRSSARPGETYPDVAALLAAMPTDMPVLAVIDDAELVADATGELAMRISARPEDFTVLAAGRGESLRASYGHWTAAVRRSRVGVVMAAANELDGDLLGATLPRRLPIPARPGLAWLVADGSRRLVQVARASTDGASIQLATIVSGV